MPPCLWVFMWSSLEHLLKGAPCGLLTSFQVTWIVLTRKLCTLSESSQKQHIPIPAREMGQKMLWYPGILLPSHPFLSTNPPIFASHFLLSDNGAKCWGHMSRQVPALLDGANILQGKTHTQKYHQIVKGVALGNNKRVALSRKGSLGRPY